MKITHGATIGGMTPEYRAWCGMRTRCQNQNNPSWPHYGGRGISVHPEWDASFESFYSHIGKRPTDAHSLDRIDNDGNYEPGNCRWATRSVQNSNRRKFGKYPVGRGRYSMEEMKERFIFDEATICALLSDGLTMTQALVSTMKNASA